MRTYADPDNMTPKDWMRDATEKRIEDVVEHDAIPKTFGINTSERAEKFSLNGNMVFPKASATGIKVDLTVPVFTWRDLLGRIISVNTGASKPSFATYRGGIKAFQFAAGDEDFITFHMPHDYVFGSDIHLHVHWSHIGALVTGGSVTFEHETTYSKSHNQEPFISPVTTTFVGAASTTQFQQILTEIQLSAETPSASQIDSNSLEPDGLIIVRIKVDANNITVSSGSAPDPFIHYADIHYQSTNIGTKEKTPDFYT